MYSKNFNSPESIQKMSKQIQQCDEGKKNVRYFSKQSGYVGRRKIIFDHAGTAKRSRQDDQAFQTMEAYADSPKPMKHFRSRRSTAHLLHLESTTVQHQNVNTQNGRPSLKAMASQPTLERKSLDVSTSDLPVNPMKFHHAGHQTSSYLKSLKLDASPMRVNKTYMTRQPQSTAKKAQETKQAVRQIVAQSAKNDQLINKMRLKPSQIIEEAKKDIKFGSVHINDQQRRGADSIVALQEYLQHNNQSQQSLHESGAGETAFTQKESSVKAAFKDKFVVREQERFNQHSKQNYGYKQRASCDDINETNLQNRGNQSIIKLHHEEMNQTVKNDQASSLFKQFQSNTSFKSSVLDVNQSTQLKKPGMRDGRFQSPSMKKHALSQISSIFHNSSNNQTQQNISYNHNNQSMQVIKTTLSKMHNTIVQQAPWYKASHMLVKDDSGSAEKKQRYLGHYPSQKLLPSIDNGGVSKWHQTDESVDNDSSQNLTLESAPYQLHLLNVSQSQKQLPAMVERENGPVPLGTKGRQQRVVKRIKMINNTRLEAAKKIQKKSKSKIDAAKTATEESLQQSSRVEATPQDPNAYRSSKVLQEVVEPTQSKPKFFPLKARKILRKAMKELDQVDLINSQQMPMSRQRIRSILRRMKESLEQGHYGDDGPDAKTIENQLEAEKQERKDSSQRLLFDIGQQAEFELFSMLLREKERKVSQQARNSKLSKLYDERMDRKRAELEKLKARQELRESLIHEKAYVSDETSSSRSEKNDSFDLEHFDEYGNVVVLSARQQEMALHHCLVSSERPSSANSDSYKRGGNRERLTRMRDASDRRHQKQKKMILEELLNLIERPTKNSSPQTGHFYNKFQNIDKIIEQEKNDKILNANYDEHLKRHQLKQSQKKIQALLKIPVAKKNFQPALHHSDDESLGNTPRALTNARRQASEATKSPIIEYLKQVQKDKLLPRFMPFKNLQEAATNIGGSTGLKYKLDSFSINTMKAPSIASAIKNMQGLRSMSLVDCRLGDEAFLIILKATQATLTSLNLSQNEHLTAKSYRVLHKFKSLAHLTLENCGIGDEILALLLALDPLKYNQELFDPIKKSVTSSKTGKKNKQAAMEVYEEEFLLSGLITSLKLFNASKNRITDKGATIVACFLRKSDKIETLLLHWNMIRQKGAISLAKAIKNNTTIRVLDLSFNSLGSGGTSRVTVAQSQKKQDNVSIGKAEQRNSIDNIECSESAWKWSKMLKNNRELLHVDISFNGFTAEDMTAIGNGLRENNSLLGFHIEGNDAKMDALGFICPIPNASMTTKNNMQFDNLRSKEVYGSHKYERIPVSMENEHMPNRNMSQKHEDLNQFLSAGPISGSNLTGRVVPRNCWLCEHWKEQKFEVRLPAKFAECGVEAVYIHLSIDDYKPMMMSARLDEPQLEEQQEEKKFGKLQKSGKSKQGMIWHQMTQNIVDQAPLKILPIKMAEEKSNNNLQKVQVFQIYRMVPPTLEGIKYYFTLDNPKSFRKETFIDQRMKKVFFEADNINSSQSKMTNAISFAEDDSEEYDEGEALITFPKFLNQTSIIKPIEQTVERNKMKCIPRPGTKDLGIRHKLRTPWDFKLSVFHSYMDDTAELLDNCFEKDWNRTRVARIVKNETDRAELKSYCRSIYKHFREFYKFIAGSDPVNDVCCIGVNTFNDMISSGIPGFVDGKYLMQADVDLERIKTNANEQNDKFNPKNSLVRHNFLEVFIRLCDQKYLKNQAGGPQVTTMAQAFKMMFEKECFELFSQFDSQKWRKDVLWREEIDFILKISLDPLRAIYMKFIGKNALPGGLQYMSLSEFNECIINCNCLSDNFGAKQIGIMYSLAMMTQVDEIDKDKHVNMVFVEFLEAIVRVADKTEIPHCVIDEFNLGVDEIMPEMRDTYAKRHTYTKLEAMIMFLIRGNLGYSTYTKYLITLSEQKNGGHFANYQSIGLLNLNTKRS